MRESGSAGFIVAIVCVAAVIAAARRAGLQRLTASNGCDYILRVTFI